MISFPRNSTAVAVVCSLAGARLLGRPTAARSLTTVPEPIKQGVAPTSQQRQQSPSQNVQAASYSPAGYPVQEEAAYVGEVDFSPELINNVKLMGNVGQEVNLRFLETGNKVANFSIALKAGKDKEGNDKTDWYDIEVWGPLAQRATEVIRKGSKVAVSGRLRVDSYIDKQGMRRKSVRVVANSIDMVRPLSDMQPMTYGGTSGQQQQQRRQVGAPEPFPDFQPQQPVTTAGSGDGWGLDDLSNTSGPQPRDEADPDDPAHAKWLRYFDSPSDWYDNRETKTNHKAPDFKHKKDTTALWLNGRDTPEWVTRQLQLGEDIPF